MCNELIQVYACGHSKDICTTPCPHAQDTASPATISRSNSVVSSIAPSAKQNVGTNSPAQRSPLRTVNPSAATPNEPRAPAFRFNIPSQHALSPTFSTTNTNMNSQHTLPSRYSTSSSPSTSGPTSPTAFSNQPPSPVTPVPNFCPYVFPPRFLPRSRFPCLGCYMQPEWEGMRSAWMDNYRHGHPMDGMEDLERLSGIEGVRERLGLL
ncbi:hypothetical protein P153DRAFT_431474 [Dothidotthia symphoricarpi CBS 119687]|uniref:Uncharacterized protein n=1 Tax=Dothidotthia symphoricarpi CBS 119687 TaxID=1392245 RepID=A0A6A6AEU5_9PLEO|nr:uncharacterized protein P153DRAFT_431474 [Dothidotthia symphoricarpi CBS 119687]KAF2129538.1 hypothetical protein P153DRAFT_431474 [Dothidotthia symphoricarpi CBS 119687]